MTIIEGLDSGVFHWQNSTAVTMRVFVSVKCEERRLVLGPQENWPATSWRSSSNWPDDDPNVAMEEPPAEEQASPPSPSFPHSPASSAIFAEQIRSGDRQPLGVSDEEPITGRVEQTPNAIHL